PSSSDLAWNNTRYGLFEVKSVQDGRATLRDVYAGDLVTVSNLDEELEPGDHLLARIESRNGISRITEGDIYAPTELVSAIWDFVDKEVKTTGAPPVQVVRHNVHRLHRLLKD